MANANTLLAAVMTDGTYEFRTMQQLIKFAKLHKSGVNSAAAAKQAVE